MLRCKGNIDIVVLSLCIARSCFSDRQARLLRILVGDRRCLGRSCCINGAAFIGRCYRDIVRQACCNFSNGIGRAKRNTLDLYGITVSTCGIGA